jgi:hypothetical protein
MTGDGPTAASGTTGARRASLGEFQTLMDAGVGNRADIAFFKFCYVDFDQGNDVDALKGPAGQQRWRARIR